LAVARTYKGTGVEGLDMNSNRFTTAKNILGHQEVVDAFEQNVDCDVPAGYMVYFHSYYHNRRGYNDNGYAPVVGATVSADQLGMSGRHYYKVLAKWRDHCDYFTKSYEVDSTLLLVKVSDYKTVTHEVIYSSSLDVFYYWGLREKKHKVTKSSRKAAWVRCNRIKRATPVWVDNLEIERKYDECRRMNKAAGFIKYHVDHVVPLAGKNISGLHVHTNLEIVPAAQNLRKGNRWSA